MQEHTKKVLFIIFEGMALGVLTIGAYLGTLMLFFRLPVLSLPPLSYLFVEEPSFKISYIVIFAFNAVWFASLKFWPLKNMHIKLVLSSLLIAFSASLITMYILTNLLQDSYH